MLPSAPMARAVGDEKVAVEMGPSAPPRFVIAAALPEKGAREPPAGPTEVRRFE